MKPNQSPYSHRSCAEVAAIMTERGFPMCVQRVQELERSAMKKLRLRLSAELLGECDLATNGGRRHVVERY